jgi:TnpA family transposase
MNEKSSHSVLRGLGDSNVPRLPGVEKHATCIYSRLKTCSSSEVAAMIKGVLRHCTQMKVEKQFVDTHGQNVM